MNLAARPTTAFAAGRTSPGVIITTKRWPCGWPAAACAGQVVGAADEIGREAVETVHHVKDLHCTILHLLGLDDNKLTYFHEGRYKQLSQVGGSVIKELIA